MPRNHTWADCAQLCRPGDTVGGPRIDECLADALSKLCRSVLQTGGTLLSLFLQLCEVMTIRKRIREARKAQPVKM